jgi:hypothetical protein
MDRPAYARRTLTGQVGSRPQEPTELKILARRARCRRHWLCHESPPGGLSCQEIRLSRTLAAGGWCSARFRASGVELLRGFDERAGHRPHAAKFAFSNRCVGAGSARSRPAGRTFGTAARRRDPVGRLVYARNRAYPSGRTFAIAASVSVAVAILRAIGHQTPRVAPDPHIETDGSPMRARIFSGVFRRNSLNFHHL